MPSWFSSHLTHTQKPRGVGRGGCRKSGGWIPCDWGIKLELRDRDTPTGTLYLQGVCVFIPMQVPVCILMSTHTQIEDLQFGETVHVLLDII